MAAVEFHRFIRRAVLGSLPLLLFFSVLEWRLTQIDTTCKKKDRALRNSANRIETLILGNSAALRGIDPSDWASPSYNLAGVSQSLEIDAQLFERYAGGRPLQRVVLGLSPLSFYFRLVDSPEAWRIGFYRRFNGIAGDGGWGQPWDFSWLWMLRLYGADAIRSWFKGGFPRDLAPDVRKSGWEERRIERAASEFPPLAAERMYYHRRLMQEGDRMKCFGALYRLSIDTRQSGARLILVNIPVDVSYESLLPHEIRKKHRYYLAAAAHQSGALLMDFQGDPQFLQRDYSDPDHLNSRGAEKLSRSLALRKLRT